MDLGLGAKPLKRLTTSCPKNHRPEGRY